MTDTEQYPLNQAGWVRQSQGGCCHASAVLWVVLVLYVHLLCSGLMGMSKV